MVEPFFPLDALNRLLGAIHDAPFFKDYPKSVAGPDSWRALPYMTPVDLQEGPRRSVLRAGDIERRIQGQSSGTTGKAKLIHFSDKDLAASRAFFAQGMKRLFGQKARVLLALPARPTSSLGKLLAEAFEDMGATMIDGSQAKDYQELADMAKEANSLLAMPRHALALGRFLHAHKLPHAIQAILLSADSMSLPIWSALEDTWDIPIYSHYGMTEFCYAGAVSFTAQGPMEVRQDHLFIEIIDKEGRVLPLGEVGEIVLTTLDQLASPLVRYRSGDRGRIVDMEYGQALDPILERDNQGLRKEQEKWDQLLERFPEVLDLMPTKKGLLLQVLPGKAELLSQQEGLLITTSREILSPLKRPGDALAQDKGASL